MVPYPPIPRTLRSCPYGCHSGEEVGSMAKKDKDRRDGKKDKDKK